jgi:hypothetical protein
MSAFNFCILVAVTLVQLVVFGICQLSNGNYQIETYNPEVHVAIHQGHVVSSSFSSGLPHLFALRAVDGLYYITNIETNEHISIKNGQLRADSGSPNTPFSIERAGEYFFRIHPPNIDLVWTADLNLGSDSAFRRVHLQSDVGSDSQRFILVPLYD